MLFLGIAFLLIAVAGEALSGTWFEDFLDPRYPRDAAAWDDEAVKVRLGRLMFWVGVVLTTAGGIAEPG